MFQVLLNDFFLIACLDDFIENARLFIFETFCRIHQCISISMLAEKLNMSPEEAERWIVNLIRNARLDAKIDSKQVLYFNINPLTQFEFSTVFVQYSIQYSSTEKNLARIEFFKQTKIIIISPMCISFFVKNKDEGFIF